MNKYTDCNQKACDLCDAANMEQLGLHVQGLSEPLL